MALCLCVGACLCLSSVAAVAFINLCLCSSDNMVIIEDNIKNVNENEKPTRLSSIIIKK
jgi:hypothetical protein